MLLEDRKRLYKLIEEWTRAEVMARIGPIGWPDCGDYHFEATKREDQIRELIYGTSNLVELGLKFGILNRGIKGGRKDVKRKNRR
jgi:hypothetical protein